MHNTSNRRAESPDPARDIERYIGTLTNKRQKKKSVGLKHKPRGNNRTTLLAGGEEDSGPTYTTP